MGAIFSVDRGDDGVATARLNRPEARNALNGELMRAAVASAEQMKSDPALRAVLLTGAAPDFSVGADLNMVDEMLKGDATLLEIRGAADLGPRMCAAWEAIEAPTIAAIEGNCVGGGIALALACDFRIASRDARFIVPEAPIGMNLGWRALPRLAALVGTARTKRIAMFGDPIDAATAEAWGLIDKVVEPGEAEAEARRWAARLAALPPVPLRMIKETVDGLVPDTVRAGSLDREQWLLCYKSSDLAEGVGAFLEKRPARFSGD